MRIDEAKKLLANNALKVYEIADLVGYSNVDYFHKNSKICGNQSCRISQKSLLIFEKFDHGTTPVMGFFRESKPTAMTAAGIYKKLMSDMGFLMLLPSAQHWKAAHSHHPHKSTQRSRDKILSPDFLPKASSEVKYLLPSTTLHFPHVVLP